LPADNRSSLLLKRKSIATDRRKRQAFRRQKEGSVRSGCVPRNEGKQFHAQRFGGSGTTNAAVREGVRQYGVIEAMA